MNKEVEIKCPKCANAKMISHIKLVPHYSKKIMLRCNKCELLFPIIVGPTLFGKSNAPGGGTSSNFGNISRDGTVVIESKRTSNNKLGTIIIQGNDLTPYQEICLSEGENTLGRKSSDIPSTTKREIVSQDKKMSRVHCIIIAKKQSNGIEYYLKDALSTNKTYLNSNALGDHDLINIGPDDLIRIGRTHLKLKE